MPKIERLALVIKLDNEIELTVPAKRLWAPRSLNVKPADVIALVKRGNDILERLKGD